MIDNKTYNDTLTALHTLAAYASREWVRETAKNALKIIEELNNKQK